MLAELDHPLLSRCQRVFEGADHQVGAGEIGPCPGWSTPELLFVEADHLARDRRQLRNLGVSRAVDRAFNLFPHAVTPPWESTREPRSSRSGFGRSPQARACS